MKYGSVCSGIEAATSAWHSLGWTPQWFSEIEPFPCKVLAHHYPQVPNLGDMTKLNQHKIYNEEPIDLLVGGTPCQSFSIAGLRGGLDDERGNLALEYCRILIAKQPKWFVWENVPGVFSSNNGKDFACLLSAFTGKEINHQGLGNTGVIEGNAGGYSVAWRVLDAQYFGVPQRRRRVFVVGHLGNDWRPPFAVLFERDSLRRDFEAGAKARKGTSEKAGRDTDNSSWWDGGNTASTLTKHNANGAQRMPDKDNFGAKLQNCPSQMDAFNFEMYSGECKEISPCLQKDRAKDTRVYPSREEILPKAFGAQNSHHQSMSLDDITPTLDKSKVSAVVYNVTFNDVNGSRKDRPQGGLYVNETEQSKTIATNGNPEVIVTAPIVYDTTQITSKTNRSNPKEETCHTLAKGSDAPLQVTEHRVESFQQNAAGELRTGDVSFTLNKNSNASGRNAPLLCQTVRMRSGCEGGGKGALVSNELSLTLAKANDQTLILKSGQEEIEKIACDQADTITIGANQTTGRADVTCATGAIARRLTPLECERLQGFSDNHTNIPGAKDSPRYAAIGNSMAVPVMHWIGSRIDKVENILNTIKK